MSNFKEIATLFALLFICTLDGYSMMNYRLSAKKSYGCFAVVAVICLAVNSYIAIRYGSAVLRNVIIFTIGFPYFALILLITDNKISQTVFNFWLWINVYEIITNFSMFVNDCTFANDTFLALMRLALLGGYFALYNLCENPEMGVMEALNMSKVQTRGQKWELFVLDLSFIGWNLLSACTFGILGLVYVNPYTYTTHAAVYQSLKASAIQSGRLSWADFGQMPPAAPEAPAE